MSENNQPIRILQWGMLSGRGGIETMIMNLYRHMDRSKVQFDFLTQHDADKLAFEDEILDMGGRVYRVMYSERESLTKSRSSLKQFFSEHSEIAGIHVNANYPYAFPLGFAAKAGVPLRILHSHNAGSADSQQPMPGIKGMVKGVIRGVRNQRVRHQIMTYPTQYMACSAAAAQYMFPGKLYTWVKNGIDTTAFAYDQTLRVTTRHKLGIADTTTVLGFCGRLRTQKNPLFLVDIFEQYHRLNPDSLLLIVGIGELKEQMLQKIREYRLEHFVKFVGAQADVSPFYQAMDTFVLPSLYEGLGIVFIEAQCSGLPCFGSLGAVPQEAGVTDLMHYVPLESGASVWAKKIHDVLSDATDGHLVDARDPRQDQSNVVRTAGYEMADVAAQLQDIYLREGRRS